MKPTPGQPYTTSEGDTPANIAGQAYGDTNKVNLIQDANDTQTPLLTESILPTGINLIIPRDVDLEQIRKKQLRRGLLGVK